MTFGRVRIGDVLELKRDRIEVLSGRAYRRIGIYSWGKGIIHHPPVDGVDMGSMRYFTFAPDALILSNIQAWEAAVAVSTAAESGEFVCSNRFLPYLPIRPDEVDVNYVKHYLLSEDGLAALRRASPGTQVRNRTLGKALFEAIEIPLPDLPEQRRIAAHLDRIGSLVGTLTGAQVHRARMSRAVVASEIDDVLDCRPVAVRDVVNLERRALDLDEEARYTEIGVRSFGRGLFVKPTTTAEVLGGKRVFVVRAGDLVVSNIFAWEGAVAVAGPEHDGMIGSHRFMTWTSTSPLVEVEYLRLYLLSNHGLARLRAASPGSAGRNRTLSIKGFATLEVPIPSLERQRDLIRLAQGVEFVEERGAYSTNLAGALLPAARNEVFSAMR